ncbi:MAG: hypothetical protein C5B50_20675 [Verrucomicrobia bacterium]|nr:MAG: hypothetical protein C5B50_20675 [Verrucomicrobiota bacterium]
MRAPSANSSTLPEPIGLQISAPVEAKAATSAAAKFAAALQFSEKECHEIELTVSELASNLLKHGDGGTLQFIPLQQQNQHGIQIVSQNQSRSSADLERALTDGFSTRGTLGAGLGAINRFMDSVEFQPSARSGLRIVCRRWVRPDTGNLRERPLEFAAATRSWRLAAENGDAFVVQQWDGHALAGVIDGLGHGSGAQRAAMAARQYLEHHFDQPIDALFRGVERACRATRGVVMCVARFDLLRQTLQLAGIGNIEVRLLGSSAPFKFVIRRGVLGMASAPKPVVSQHAWTPECVLVMQSDGVKNNWQPDEVKSIPGNNPVLIAKHLLDRYGTMNDDSTVLVVKNRRRRGEQNLAA